jgi:hypothetical protein
MACETRDPGCEAGTVEGARENSRATVLTVRHHRDGD